MKKTLIILLTALLSLTVFVSCEGDIEDLFGKNITITFNGNGSTGGQMAALEVEKGTQVKLTANAFEKTDNVFTGWNTKADGTGTGYEDEAEVSFEKDTTLYAQWDIYVFLTSTMTSWENGIYTLDPDGEDLEISSRITVTGSVTLLLPAGKTLTAPKGITVTGSNSLTINGGTGENAGTLLIDGVDEFNAGIGGGGNGAGGTVTITGGTVTVKGGTQAAGIGGGDGGAGGTVTITGGTVTATGGDYYGAGIGGGLNSNGGTVTITGGTVTATGGYDATGIGKGFDGDSNGTLAYDDVTLMVSNDGSNWEEYDGTTRGRYMRTK